MGLPRLLVGEIRRLNESQLRQLLILARGLLLDTEVPVVEIGDIPGMPAVRYRQRSVTCGKPTCTGCPHGPYWYAHWTEEGRKRSQYIGSELPTAVRHKLEALEADRTRRLAGRSSTIGSGSPGPAAGSDGGPAPDPAPGDRGSQTRASMAATAGGEPDLRPHAGLRLVRGDH
ncbi:MAG TPA: hypothetical protein VMM13_00170 [Euzebya sp.]|nr:hypothetical protein [Euzebya sp.]